MVVLSAAVCTKSGKCLLSRQFVEMTRIRIEGILAAFPKLIGSGSKQHTFVETESVRYVYQPLENLYMLLVTTKGSNIMEDLDTLRLLSKVLPDVCNKLDEESVLSAAYEIVFAFDEAITLGYKENVTLQAIRTNLEMESHEEKLHQMIITSKMNDAKDTADKKRQEIKQKKKDMQARGIKMEGIGNPNFPMPDMGHGSSPAPSSSSYDAGPSMSSTSASSGYPGSARSDDRSPKPAASSSSGSGLKLKKGMVLKKKEKDSNFMQQMYAEDGIDAVDSRGGSAAAPVAAAAPGAVVQRTEDVDVSFSETVSMEMNKDGGLNLLDIKGQAHVVCYKPDLKLKIQLSESAGASKYQFNTHPSIDKAQFSQSKIIAQKKADRSFPQDSSLIFKWRLNSKDDSDVPLVINCWPQPSGNGVFNINIEYTLEADIELHDVVIKVPLSGSGAPEIESVDCGEHRYNSRYQVIEWTIDVINQSNATGALEFNIEADDEEGFFPISTTFSSNDTLCPVGVAEVKTLQDEPVRFAAEKKLNVNSYMVVSS